jgi:hypothetical protein
MFREFSTASNHARGDIPTRFLLPRSACDAALVFDQVVDTARNAFVNSDNWRHEMTSDPHPEHSDCAEIKFGGYLNPWEATRPAIWRTCVPAGFQDHGEPDKSGLKGRIIIR